MQGDLSALKVSLARVETSTEKGFNGEIDGFGSVQVDGEVDDAVGAKAEDGEQLEATIVDTVSDKITAGGSEGVVGHAGDVVWWCWCWWWLVAGLMRLVCVGDWKG